MPKNQLFEHFYFSTMFFLLSFGGYFYLAYFVERTDTAMLISLWISLSVLSFIHVQKAAHWQQILYFAIIFRVIFIFANPALSDDFVRFLWDGMIVLDGGNPYSHTPEAYFGLLSEPSEKMVFLYKHLNSQQYYSVYPPIVQIYFLVGALGYTHSLDMGLFALHFLVLLAEYFTLIGIIRLLDQFKLPRVLLGYYALNPLTIIELSENLHPEAIMLPFLVWGFYWLAKSRWAVASLLWGMAIAAKLLPLMFLPLLYRKLGFKVSLKFYLLIGLWVGLAFSPIIYSGFQNNMWESVQLYFQKFEFNASVYYLLREAGIWIKGYNPIALLAPALAVFVFIVVLALSAYKRATWRLVLVRMMWISVIFLLLSTTVHPWYLSIVILLSLFSNFRFPVVWSMFIVLSYSAYATSAYQEIPYLTAISYLVPLAYFFLELRYPQKLLR